MGIKILRGMSQSPKSDPGREHTRRKQGGKHKATLFFDVTVTFVDGVVVEVKFVVTDLPRKRVLFAVGCDNHLKRARAKFCTEGFAGHFFMNGNKHFQIISEAGATRANWL